MPCRSRKRVVPSEPSTSIIEIRPSRYLRIQHHNPRPRDENFNKEMTMFMQYKKSGIPSSGPLSMPKRFSKSSTNQRNEDLQIQQQHHPLAVNHMDNNQNSEEETNRTNHQNCSAPGVGPIDENILSKDSTIISMPASKASSALSSPARVMDDKIHSASSVQVAMHMKRLAESKCHSNNAEENIISEASQPEIQRTHAFVNSQNQTSQISYSTKHTNLDFTKQPNGDNKEVNTVNDPLMNGKTPICDIVIFLIHGVGGSSDIWCSQIQHFVTNGYEVVAPDLIGHGFSSCPKTPSAYHFKETAADMEEIFDKYCKKRNVIIGHSYGASFATLLARSRSRRVHKLVLVSGGPPTPLAPQPGVFNLPGCMLGCIKPCLVCGFNKGAFHKKRKAVVPKTEAFNIPAYVLQHTMNGQIWADGDEFYHNWLTCPTLLVYGAEDKLVTLDEELHMKEAIYNSQLVIIEDASHMVMIEAPVEVNKLLSDFIQHVPEPKTSRTSDSTSQIHSQPHSSRQMPEISLKRSISHISQKSIRSLRSHRSMPRKSVRK